MGTVSVKKRSILEGQLTGTKEVLSLLFQEVDGLLYSKNHNIKKWLLTLWTIAWTDRYLSILILSFSSQCIWFCWKSYSVVCGRCGRDPSSVLWFVIGVWRIISPSILGVYLRLFGFRDFCFQNQCNQDKCEASWSLICADNKPFLSHSCYVTEVFTQFPLDINLSGNWGFDDAFGVRDRSLSKMAVKHSNTGMWQSQTAWEDEGEDPYKFKVCWYLRDCGYYSLPAHHSSFCPTRG